MKVFTQGSLLSSINKIRPVVSEKRSLQFREIWPSMKTFDLEDMTMIYMTFKGLQQRLIVVNYELNRSSGFREEDFWSFTIYQYKELWPSSMTLTLKIWPCLILLLKTFAQRSMWQRMNKISPVVSEKKNFEGLLYTYVQNFDIEVWPWPWRYDLALCI